MDIVIADRIKKYFNFVYILYIHRKDNEIFNRIRSINILCLPNESKHFYVYYVIDKIIYKYSVSNCCVLAYKTTIRFFFVNKLPIHDSLKLATAQNTNLQGCMSLWFLTFKPYISYVYFKIYNDRDND